MCQNEPIFNEEKLLATSTENFSDFRMVYEQDRENLSIGALRDIVTGPRECRECVYDQSIKKLHGV